MPTSSTTRRPSRSPGTIRSAGSHASTLTVQLDPNAANATPGGSSAPTPLKPSRDLGGIDPDLAYLDPTLAHGPRAQIAGGFAARFNARTGKFEGDPNRNPDSVSEFTRQRKKEEFYFDVGAHDSQRAKEQMERIAQGASADSDEEADRAQARTRPSRRNAARSS